jgi:hypothetical protein
MNRSVWEFISILIITFGLIVFYSFRHQPISVMDYDIKQSGVKDYLWGEALEVPAFAEQESLKSLSERDTVITDTSSQRILLIGDSMLEGLMLRLRDYAEYNEHDMKSVIWYSSSTLWYGTSDTLSYFINEYEPTYVMLVLGANELFISDIKNKRLKYVRRIISQVDTLPYVWIGPPNWKDDTGINELILSNTGERRYFPSKDLTYNRTSDGAHPTRSSAAEWMDSVAVWIQTKGAYRFDLEVPPDSIRYRSSPNATLLQPKK